MTSRLSPVWLVLIGILSVQFGAGIAKSLFDEVAPTVIVWLRLVTSAVVLTLVARPLLRAPHPPRLARGRRLRRQPRAS